MATLRFAVCANFRRISSDYGGGATRPLPRDGGVEELHGDPTVGPKNGRSGAEDDALERLGCGTARRKLRLSSRLLTGWTPQPLHSSAERITYINLLLKTYSWIICYFPKSTNAAFTLNGFDNQERNLTFVKTDFLVF